MEFKAIIKEYLDNRAKQDLLFAKTYQNPNKNLDECCKYIMSEAKKLAKDGACAMKDDDVFNLAVHYYDEDDIKFDSAVKAKVATSAPMPVQTTASTSVVASKPIIKSKSVENQLALF